MLGSTSAGRLSLRQSTWLIYGAVLLLGLTASALVYYNGERAREVSEPLTRQHLPLFIAISQLKSAVAAYEPILYEYYATTDRPRFQRRLVEQETKINEGLQTLGETYAADPLLAEVQREYRAMGAIAGQLDGVLKARRVDWDLARALLEKLTAHAEGVNSRLDLFVTRTQQAVSAASVQTSQRIAVMVKLTLAYSFAIFIVAIFVGHSINARNAAEQRLLQQARHDALTGLPNRYVFEEDLADLRGRNFAVMILLIDRFKHIVATLGHAVGDALLTAAVVRLQEALEHGVERAVDEHRIEFSRTQVGLKVSQLAEAVPAKRAAAHRLRLYRLDGATFGLLLAGVSEDATLADAARLLLAEFRHPLLVDQRELYVSFSVGGAFYPRDGGEPATLIRNATAAADQAKQKGGNGFRAYDQELNARAMQRLAMENELRRAVERNELRLVYQPQAELDGGRMFGAETLLRWYRGDRMVSPADFIPLAEETGLIVPIGEWVLRTACKQNRAWQDAGLAPVIVAVNISPKQFQQPDFVKVVEAVLKQTGLGPQWLELEITEGAVIAEIDHAIAVMTELKALGVRLAVDDFGTGYSSLAYLKRFPIDKLKIDQSFVRHLTDDPKNLAITNTVIRLGQSLGLTVIAEGVETYEQLSMLYEHGCNELQGYLFSRPVPQEEFEQMLVDRRSLLDIPTAKTVILQANLPAA